MGRQSRTAFVRVASLCTALSLAAPVAAAEPAASPAESGFSDGQAESLYNTGLAKFDEGDYEGALVDLDASLAIESSVRALYAKAQAFNKLERCRDAVPLYNRVLGSLPDDSPARPAVKDALVTCAEKLAEEEDTPPLVIEKIDSDEPLASSQAADEPTDNRPKGTPLKPWYKDPYAPIMIGLGAAGAGVGGYFLARAAEEDAQQPTRYDEFESKEDRVTALRIRGGVLAGVGGALILAGVIRWAVLGVKGKRARTALAPVASPRWAGVVLRGSF